MYSHLNYRVPVNVVAVGYVSEVHAGRKDVIEFLCIGQKISSDVNFSRHLEVIT
jgi:hypothetical protein